MMVHALRIFGRDERGIALVELAAVAPFLALLTVGISDLTMAINDRVKLQHAVHRTLEQATSREIEVARTANNYDFSDYRQKAAAEAGVPVDNVTVTTWLECNGTEQASGVLNCPTGSATARYLQIGIRSTFTPIFAAGPIGSAPGQLYHFKAEGAVRIV